MLEQKNIPIVSVAQFQQFVLNQARQESEFVVCRLRVKFFTCKPSRPSITNTKKRAKQPDTIYFRFFPNLKYVLETHFTKPRSVYIIMVCVACRLFDVLQ